MKHIVQKFGIAALAGHGIVLILCALPAALAAQAFSTTTVQGTVYLANGAPGSGTVWLSWPAFTTAASQAVAAGRVTATIGADGFLSVNLAPNAGATPAGLYYTAVYHLSDGTTSTEYWTVPAAAQATIAQVRATVMPAAQAVQAVSKTYVDQAVLQAAQSQLTASGGNLTGPLYLNGDPGSPTQAATKHYVDNQFSQALSVNGGTANGPLTATQLGAIYQADQFTGADFGANLQGCINALNATYGGTCDARNFTGTLGMAANVNINKANATVNLPCATISTASQMVVTAGTRNVTLHGCASRGTTATSGNQGGTVILYAGNGAAIEAGDATYASDTLGFHLDNVVINTTGSTAATAQAIAIWRTQELHLEALYLLGNGNQTGMTLDGTGNYTGGTLTDVEIGGYQNAINGIGHQVANPATTDWVNASTFVRLHIDCPTANGNPIAGTTGINLLQGDGNMFSGGDVEGCATALHLGPNAQNNTIVGLRNENSTYQVVADAGSAYNNWMTGGTMFTGKLTDNGTRNSFLDTFHRSFNGMNGDWYGSQQDATVMNHYRLGIGNGNERGLQNRYQTDYGYRWTTGLTDAMAGEQFYQVLDELNNVNRLSIGQYNNGQSSTNNQTVINAAGTGAVVLNGSNNAGSGGVVIGSGGPASTTVATINNAGNAQFNGTLQVGGTTTFTGSPSVKNQADAEIDYFLQAGATAPQKESVTYKDWNGASQWYLVKDTSNNWALNSAVGGVDSFKAYQSTNSGDTYIDAANNTGVVRVNYEPGSGSAFNVYGGGSSSLYASFNGTTGIKFPGLAAGSGHSCMQIDSSGYLSNTGSACAGSAVGAGTTGQIAYYPGNGSSLAGMAAVPVTAGGTGATSAAAALTSLGGLALSGGTLSGTLTLAGDPTANLHATTKQYVDAAFNGSANDQTARAAASAAQSTANGALPLAGGNMSGALVLASDQPSGHQAASANAAVGTYLVTAYGGKGDARSSITNSAGTSYFSGSMTAGGNVMTVGTYTPASGDVGKYIAIWNPTAQPFASTAFAALSGWTPNNVAKITAVNGSTVTLNKTALNSFSGNITVGSDNADPAAGLNYCESSANTLSGGSVCMLPPGNYGLFTAPYYILTGAQDDGSPGGTPAGGSGASVTAVLGGINGSQIVSYTVNSGGSGYTPNRQLQVSLTGGCGSVLICGQAFALASTNSSGAVTSVTPVYTGFGYVAAPTVTVQPLGGDGAAATATLSGSTIGSFAVTAAGGGYPANSSVDWFALQGTSGCTVISGNFAGMAPYVAKGTASTNAAGQVTGLSIATNATGCTSAPVIVFGDFACNSGSAGSPVWGQCSNVAPLNPIAFPVHVFINGNVSFVGQSPSRGNGSTLTGSWDNNTVDINQPAIIGGYIRYQDIKNVGLAGEMLGVLANNNMNYAKMQDVNFNTAWGMWTAATDIGSIFDNLTFNGNAGWVNGGTWAHRANFPTGQGGFFDAESVTNILSRLQAYGGPGSISQKLDDFFNNNWWHAEYSANSADFSETCKFPQAANQRQTGVSMMTGQFHANGMCFPGITSIGQEILERDSRSTGGATYNTLVVKQVSRNIFCCDVGGMQMTNLGCEACTPLTGTNDPYRNATTLEGAIKTMECSSSMPGSNGFLNQVSYSGANPLWSIFSIPTQGNPKCLGWTNNSSSGTNAQASQNPGFTSQINFPFGLAIYPHNGINSNFDFYDMDSNAQHYEGALMPEVNGFMFRGADGTTDKIDFQNDATRFNEPLYAKSGFYDCGGGSFCAQLAFAGTANRTVTIPDSNSTTVQGAGSASSGQVVQYIDTNGVQHYTPASSYTAPQVAALFSGCSGTMYLGADGACHTASGALATVGSPGTVQPDGSTITISGGVISAANPSAVNPDSVTCSNVSLSTSPANVCALTIPPNRVPYGGVYQVSAFCGATLVASGTASSYIPQLRFYNAANSTTYNIANNNSLPTASIGYGYVADISFTGFSLLAPASGAGFTQAGGYAASYRYDGGNMTALQGASTTFQPTPALVSSSGSNQIQIWMSTSFANASPNTVTCSIVGTVLH